MAEILVEPLLGPLIDGLTRLINYNIGLISNAKNEVEGLKRDIMRFRAFLVDSSGETNYDQSMQVVMDDIRRLVYQAEDVIDKYVVEKVTHQTRNTLERTIHVFDHPVTIRNIAQEIADIRQEISKTILERNQITLQTMQLVDKGRRRPAEKQPPVVEEDNVVGFDGEARIVSEKLIGGGKNLSAITIVGLPGQGKTTLARMIYKDPTIKYEFFPIIWIHVSQEYSIMEIFMEMLNRFTTRRPTSKKFKTVEPIIEELRTHLSKRKYLIILDDVWTEEAWDRLQRAFPNNDKGSRVLITTRQRTVALHANRNGNGTHDLKFLEDRESQELLELKVFGKGISPPPDQELKSLGEQIAVQCKGLPLAVVVIAGILLNNRDSSSWWEQVANNVKTFIVTDQKRFMEVVAWSYRHLPYHLKSCFLYLGVFRKGSDIHASKLVRLWIAEGFIGKKDDDDRRSLEDIAEASVTDLINRNLLITVERKGNGQIKTCRVHDILRDFCTAVARKQNLYHEVETPKQLATPTQYRRVCIHSPDIEKYLPPKLPVHESVRSFLCFPKKGISIDLERVLMIPKTFELLKVLDIESITFDNFPRNVVELALLSYLALSCKIDGLPSSISKLWNMQTLIIKTQNPTLKLKEEVWKMYQLRHLHTDASAQLPSPPEKGILENMQSLSRISPESCTRDVFVKTPQIKKLGVRGRLVALLSNNNDYFDNIGELENLVNLKLENDVRTSKPEIPGLPPAHKFPRMLKKLTLSKTLLGWKHMEILAQVKKLEVLKLKDYAFKGDSWQMKDGGGGGFASLKLLHIERTDLVMWEASKNHFPCLKSLALRHCDKLEAVPQCLANVPSFKELKLHYTNPQAAASAREIDRIKTEFMLTIYPPDTLQD